MAVEATRGAFRERFAEFASRSDADVDQARELALAIHTARPLATLYLMAHVLSLDPATSVAGEVTMDWVGNVRAMYMAQAETGDESFFTRTEYGRRYLVLARRSPTRTVAAVVV